MPAQNLPDFESWDHCEPDQYDLMYDHFMMIEREKREKEEVEFLNSIRLSTSISDAEAERISSIQMDVFLDELLDLSVEAADWLSKHKGQLHLNGLKMLSDEVSFQLRRHKGGLCLNGLSEVSETAIEALSGSFALESWESWISLGGLTDLPESSIICLTKQGVAKLILGGLSTISDESAIALAKYRGSISLDGLKTLSPVAAIALLSQGVQTNFDIWEAAGRPFEDSEAIVKIFAPFRDRPLNFLSDLRKLSDSLAMVLADHKEKLWLDNLCDVSPTGAFALLAHARVKTGVNLQERSEELTDLSEKVAHLAVKHGRPLNLNCLSNLSEAAARALGNSSCDLFLNGLIELSDEAALALVPHSGELSLNGMESLTPLGATALLTHGEVRTQLDLVKIAGDLSDLPKNVARILVRSERNCLLNGLKKLPAEVAKVIAGGAARGVFLNGLTLISEEAAMALAEVRGILSLGLTELTESVALILARHVGPLYLDGLTTLSESAALALSGRVGELHMGGLTRMPDNVALALVGHKGAILCPALQSVGAFGANALLAHGAVSTPLDLLKIAKDLREITEKLARIVATRWGDLFLDHLTQLSEECARLLSVHCWELSLNGITELSDAAAFALVEHPGKIYLKGLKTISPAAAEVMLTKGNIDTYLELGKISAG